MQEACCRLLPFEVADGAWQMAADEILLEGAAAGQAALRFYAWSEATLSLGYFQPAAQRQRDPHLAEIPFVRRPTGGEALVHHHEVTYALALPGGPPWQRRGESWLQRMHVIIAAALARYGIPASLCASDEEQRQGEVLCFLHHTPGDLRIGSAKVVGSAQRKTRGALLQHGGILLAASPHAPQLLGVAELTGQRLTPGEVQEVVVEELVRRTGWCVHRANWTEDERRRIDAHRAARYTQPAWNNKR